MNILSQHEFETLKLIVSEANSVVLCCHKSPDGDAIGSVLAFAEYLSSLKGDVQVKNVQVIVPDSFPVFLQWLPGAGKILRYDKDKVKADELLIKADTIFYLDFNTFLRVDEMKNVLFVSKARKVMIDHHLNPDIDTALSISRPEMSSTSEIVFRLIWQLGGYDTMSKSMAECIYCGMMTDTGGFVYNSNVSDIYIIIGHLLSKGIDKDKIYRNVYNNYSIWAMRFRGHIMDQRLKVMPEYHASYFTITKQDMLDYHFVKGDAEGLVNEPLRIRKMKLSIALREDTEKENQVLVSLRSVDDFPCNEMAARFFYGGGHLNASGGRLNCTIDEAQDVVVKAIKAYERELKA